MPNNSPYYNAWDDTAAEQGDACPEGWGQIPAFDRNDEQFAAEILEEQAQRERAVVRENTKHSTEAA